MGVYDYSLKDMKGADVKLSEYEGKVLLIVNTATQCGFTPQYSYLEDLYEAYKDKGLVIIDVPCDQFGHQAPGTNDEIAQFCDSRFGITFPQFGKSDVNGENELPLYTYLKGEKGFEGFDEGDPLTGTLNEMLAKADPDFAKKPDIKWNFTKFAVNRKGEVVARFEPTATKERIEECIKALL